MWNIIILDEISAKHKLINQFQGHGGDVTCVRFPCNSVDILASTATDKTARIWDVVRYIYIYNFTTLLRINIIYFCMEYLFFFLHRPVIYVIIYPWKMLEYF